jgi:protoporphyrinogen/coproporphyrinogen III oxidase
MIAVIGGGISGLAVAIELQKWCEPCVVFDPGSQPGGFVHTRYQDGFLLELGPNTIFADQEIRDYIKYLDLEQEIIKPRGSGRNRFIYRNGRYHKLPSNPLSLLTSGLLSFRAKAAIFNELRKKSDAPENETIRSFIERRFSKEIADYLAAPFISGIYAGDISRLQVSETFPALIENERQYGSVIKGFIKNKSAGKKESLYFKGGMQTLTDRMAEKVKKLRLNTRVESIKNTSDGFSLTVSSNGQSEIFHAAAVVFATPSDVMASLLKNLYPSVSEELNKINYAPAAKIFLGYNRKDLGDSLKGFGALNPPCENQFTLGSVWNSSIFPHVSPADKFLITSIAGGLPDDGKIRLDSSEIIQKVKKDIQRYFKIKGEPVFEYIWKTEKAIPQYDLQQKNSVARISDLEENKIFVCSNWIGGPSLADCIKKARKTAIRVTETMSGIAEYKGCC